MAAHIDEYAPGSLALATESETSHRSGFHSQASSPHDSLLLLAAETLSHRVVPLGTGSFVTSSPAEDFTGYINGMTSSSRHLEPCYVNLSPEPVYA